jgi:hypothetical protein
MAGDYERFTFRPESDIAGVLMQQGRVLLGSDWTELVDVFDRRFRAETMDIIGRAVVPRMTPDGFLIQVVGADLSIGRGRAYVDGLLAENHGAGSLEYDSSLGETHGQQPILYSAQPYFPNPPALPDGGQHLVYLDVWNRELTWLEKPDRIEKAVGVDTVTQIQTVWQVKVLANVGPDITCSTPDASIPGWMNLIAPSSGRLTTAASGVPASSDPCIIPPNGGYRGPENRLYRVEIHNGGPLGVAQFKFSRNNASEVASPVKDTGATGDTLLVVRIGRDAFLRFAPGDWVEITDDVQELAGAPGDMRQVSLVDEVSLTITVKPALPPGKYDATQPNRHTRVTKWDQKGKIFDPLGNFVTDVDANGGLIPVPLSGSIMLEDGVQVTFSADPAGGSFHAADYWCFAARTVDASVELLDNAPPRGVLHHYARLAIVTFPSPALDCRTLWPPDFGGAGCECTACVTADGHNSGKLTIQQAVDTVAKSGGTVCLGPGIFSLTVPLQLNNLGHQSGPVTIRGQGGATILVFAGDGPAIIANSSSKLRIEDLTLLTTSQGPTTAGPLAIGIWMTNGLDTTIERCGILAAAFTDNCVAVGILLQTCAGTTIRQCAIGGLVPTPQLEAIQGSIRKVLGIDAAPPPPPPPLPPPLPPPPGAAPDVIRAAVAMMLDGVLQNTLIRDNEFIADVGIASASLFGIKGALGSTALSDLEVADNLLRCNSIGALPAIGESPSSFGGQIKIRGNRATGCNFLAIGLGGLSTPNTSINIADNYLDVSGIGIVCAADGAQITDNVITAATAPASPATPAAIFVTNVTLTRGEKLPIAQVRILRNRISLQTGSGIVVSGVPTCSIADNSITNVVGSGITVAGPSPEKHSEVMIRNNEIFSVLTHTVLPPAGPSATGIDISNFTLTTIENNTIALIGNDASAVEARGINVLLAATVSILGNDLSNLGGGSGTASGITVSWKGINATQVSANISSNTVRHTTSDASQQGSFFGITVSNQVSLFSRAIVSDNLVEGSSSVQAVLVNMSVVDGVLTGNVCKQSSETLTPGALVSLAVADAIASNNHIRCFRDQRGLDIIAPTSRATIVGNVVVIGSIALNGVPFNPTSPQPWAPLNLFG